MLNQHRNDNNSKQMIRNYLSCNTFIKLLPNFNKDNKVVTNFKFIIIHYQYQHYKNANTLTPQSITNNNIQQKIKLMSEKKFVQQTLTMPQNMPLFNYNLNFKGLRQLMQTINIQTNTNTQQISSLKEQLTTKLHADKLKQQEQILKNCFLVGVASEKVVEDGENFADRLGKREEREMTDMEVFGNKMGKLAKVVQFLVGANEQNKNKIDADQHKHQKNIDESFRRIDQKITSSLDSMTKTINMYFTQTNKKLAGLETESSTHKRETAANFETVNNNLNQRISEAQLKAALNGLGQKVKSSILGDLDNDQMKRLAAINQYSNKLQIHINQSELKIKAAKQHVKELSQKVAKSLPIQSFETEKHKIFEKLSEYKTRIDDLNRKNQQFFDFRKSFYQSNQRVKHNLLDLEDQIKRLGDKGSSFKKMQDMTSILQKLDPHLICEIGNQVKLHQKQLGKLEKQVAYLQTQLQSARNSSTKMPQVNNGQTADLIIKLIKEYMTNLDFDGRMKRSQRQLHDLSKRGDSINDLQKKIYMLSKELDVGAIMKQLKRKCDEENTKKDFKILDSKLEKLFEFYKQTRRQIEDLYKKSTRVSKESTDNASLTTKKLFSPNCLSCTPRQRPQSTRHYSRSKIDASFDESLDQIKHSMYVRGSNN